MIVIVFVIGEKDRDRDRDWKKRFRDHDGNVIIYNLSYLVRNIMLRISLTKISDSSYTTYRKIPNNAHTLPKYSL